MVAGELARTIAPLRLLEREAELAALEAMLAAARLGDGRLVVVEGSAGIGKTRLLAEVRALAQACDLEVLTARGGELEGEFAFGIVRQLFEAPLAAATPELHAELLAGAAELSASLFASAPTSASEEGAESSFAMLHGLYWLTANFASRRPTLLVVDDLHWADEPSLRWLHYLSRRLEGLPVLLLLGTRPPEQANLPALVEELVADSAGVVMRLGGLGQESAAALARERLGGEPAAAFAAALETGSGGNPLYLVALLDAVWRQGLAPTAEHAPQVLELGPRAVSYGVSTRLARLPTESTDLLRAAAILGDRTDLPLAAALAGTDPGTALTAASALVRADLLRHENPLEFTHPVVRSAVLENMSADERTRAHRQAAALLLDRGALPEQAATYLVRTVPSGDRFVVATLRRAAARSFLQGAPEAAAAYLRRALEEPPDSGDRAEVLAELGFAETHTDAVAAAEHLSQAIAELNDPTRRTNAVLAYAHVLNLFGRRVRESAELLQETSQQLGDEERELAERVDALLIIACRYDAELYPMAAAQWEKRGSQVSERGLGTGLMLVVGSIQEALAGVSRERAIDLGRKALSSGLLQSEDRMYLTSALAALAMAGEVDEANLGLERVIAAADRSGDRLTAAGHRLWRGLVHYEAGELLLAEQDLILEPIPFWQASTPLAYRAGFLTQVLLERGAVDEAEQLIANTSLDNVQDAHRIHCVYGRGRLRLESGPAARALADFIEVRDLAESVQFRNPAWVPWRSQAAIALQRLGRQDDARALAREELELSRTWGAPRTVGISLRALGLVEGGQAGEELLREAVEVLAGSPARLEHARALVDLGALLRRENSRSEARKLLRHGVELAHRCGATALVARGNEELAATGAHPRTILLSGLDALTASERRVAQMAADDLSNKEIAQALFVTVKTVEQHLGRVYRKLDIGSRKDLGAALAAPA
jgi:DNA-binding CsgD family transcriptional regulator